MSTPFARRLREIKDERRTTVRAIAARACYSKSYIQDLLTGARQPTTDVARDLDTALGAGGELVALAALGEHLLPGDELDALELARRVEASDVSGDTLDQLQHAFDGLAAGYSTVPATELIVRIRHHLGYVGQLLDARMNLRQRRQLVIIGGWLSLLAGTVHIDLHQYDAAAARLRTANQLAGHAEHPEIQAWCLETRAWQLLNHGRYETVVDLSRQAQALAPSGSSVEIQAIAQEARGWSRMKRRTETRAALDRVNQLVAVLDRPERPEHHYVYDPAKSLSYQATTLAWAGDPAAEGYARTLIAELEADGSARPRRIALARLDLGLALLASGQPDEAAHLAIVALRSGRIVPANWWRVTEVVRGVDAAGIAEAADLREVYEERRPQA